MIETSSTFGGWSDRVTYLLAEGQLIALGVLFSLGAAIIYIRPSLPGIPPIFFGWFAALLLLGPPLLGLFVTGVRRLRERRMVEVYHVNGTKDINKKYYVAPEIWKKRKTTGPNPYPINGGDSWAVREFEYVEETNDLVIKGVWLSECEDTKLYTKRSHFEAIHGKLSESHIALGLFRDSVSEFGADIQAKLINSMAEARERGKMLDERAVKTVFDEFEDRVTSLGPDDLPTLEPEDLPGDVDQLADEALEEIDTPADAIGPEPTPAATDGGEDR